MLSEDKNKWDGLNEDHFVHHPQRGRPIFGRGMVIHDAMKVASGSSQFSYGRMNSSRLKSVFCGGIRWKRAIRMMAAAQEKQTQRNYRPVDCGVVQDTTVLLESNLPSTQFY